LIEASEAADTVLYRGTVHTVDEAHPRAQGVAVRGDRIVCVSTNEEVARWIGPGTRTIDLGGRIVIPGLIDSHVHMEWYGRSQEEIDLHGARSYDEAVSRVEARVRGVAPGEWMFGHGWDQTDWKDSRLPSHGKLSAISPDNPVWLVRGDGHSGLANARAMEIARIARHTPDPDGGEILRDPDTGALTGVLVDRGMQLVAEHFPTASSEDTTRHILKAADDAVSVGLTGVHDAGITYETIEIYKRLAGDRRLRPRVYAMLGGFDRFLDDYFRLEPIIGHADHHFTMRSIKLAIDGAMGSRGALLFEDYSDRPGHRGIAIRDSRLIASIAAEALKRGFQVNVHAIGDLGNHTVLNAFEEALAKHSKNDHRFRIEHVQLISLEDIPRFKRLGVIPSMQQTHATSDIPWAEARVGPERVKGNYAWRKLLDSGSILAGGSDFPIESINPLRSLYAAVTRQSADGHPPGGWHPEERMTLEEALKSFTLWAAYAAFEERLKGSITPGKLADLVVLSKDIMRIPPQELLTTEVLMTIVGGEIVYRSPASPR
jgi:predicted amidohydrolase YtcJ